MRRYALLAMFSLLVAVMAYAQQGTIPVGPAVTGPSQSSGAMPSTVPLPLDTWNGGTGTSNPIGVQSGTGISVTGDFPNQTVAAIGTLTGYVNVKDPAYGAKGDGSTDDTNAIQAAINAACAQSPGAEIFLPPTPSSSYRITAPLLFNCATAMDGAGWTQTRITQNYFGPSIIMQAQEPGWKPPYTSSITRAWQNAHGYAKYSDILDANGNIEVEVSATDPCTSGGSTPTWAALGSTVADNNCTWVRATTGTQLASGTGTSLDAADPEFFSGAGYGNNNATVEMMNPGGFEQYIQGLAAFSVEFYVEPLADDGGDFKNWNFVQIQQGNPIPNVTNSLTFGVNGNMAGCASNCLYAQADIGGVVKTVSPTGAASRMTAYQRHHIELSYDGSTLRLFLDGALSGSTAATGTWTILPFSSFEIASVGAQAYPGMSPHTERMPAFYDSVRISKVARHVAPFTAPTAKATSDSNTVFLENFPTSPVGTMLADVNNGTNAYIPVETAHGGQQINPGFIGNMQLADNGIWAAWAVNSTIENIAINSAGRTCINLFDNDYQSTISHSMCNAVPQDTHTEVGFVSGVQSNNNRYLSLQCDGQQACTIANGGFGEYTNLNYTNRGRVYYPYVLFQSAGTFINPVVDIEDADANYKANILTTDDWGPLTIVGGVLTMPDSGTAFMEVNAGAPINATGTTMQGATPSELVKISGNPDSPVTLKDTVFPANTPFVNSGKSYWVHATNNGKDQGMEYADLPACDASTAGIMRYLTDGTPGATCAGSSTGAWAQCLNGAWSCNGGGTDLTSYTGNIGVTGSGVSGTDQISHVNVNGVLNVKTYGASGSLTTESATTIASNASVTVGSAGDFKVGQHVVLFHAGPTPAVTAPTGVNAYPVSYATPSAGTSFTSLAVGCNVQNAVGYGTATSTSLFVSNASMYEVGNSIVVTGAGTGGGDLTATITDVHSSTNVVTLNTPIITSIAGAVITGANCTTHRRYKVVAIDANGGMSAASSVADTGALASSALNWGDLVEVVAPTQANAIAYAFYGCEGTSCTPSSMVGVEVPTWNFENSGLSTIYKDVLLSLGGSKIPPTVVTLHDIGMPYGSEIVEGSTAPSGAVADNLYTTITGISGTTITLANAPSLTGTFTLSHDDSPAFNATIAAACQTVDQTGSAGHCSKIQVPSGYYPIAQTISALRAQFFTLQGDATASYVGPDASGGSSTLRWVGPLGGTALLMNQIGKPLVQHIGIQTNLGSTLGVGVDFDMFDPDGGGITVTSTAATFRDVFVEAASVAYRLSNQDDGNVEFSEFDRVNSGSYGKSGVGVWINDGNSLQTGFKQSEFTGAIGIVDMYGGLSADQVTFGANSVGIWNTSYSHPISLTNSRAEFAARIYYCPLQDGTAQNHASFINNEWTGANLLGDTIFIQTSGGGSLILDNNEFDTIASNGINGAYPVSAPHGLISTSASPYISILARGNNWDTNPTPWADGTFGGKALYNSLTEEADTYRGTDSAIYPINLSIAQGGQTTPTLSAGCNGAGSSVLAGSNNNHGSFTTQTAATTTCTLAFDPPLAVAPVACMFIDGSASATPVAFSAGTVDTNHAVVDFASHASIKVNYICQ